MSFSSRYIPGQRIWLGELLTIRVLMKILITNNTLANLGGSEWVVIELAKTLISRGHEVAACSSQIGEAGSLLRGMSVPTIPDPLVSPFKPDVIHGQHHLDTMRALCAFPDVPAIYHCHGYCRGLKTPQHIHESCTTWECVRQFPAAFACYWACRTRTSRLFQIGLISTISFCA